MAKNKKRVGVEITEGYINLAMFSKGEILKTYSKALTQPIPKGDSPDAYRMLAHEIRIALKEGDIAPGDCAWSMLPDDVYIRHITKPLMSVDELELMLPLEFIEYVPDDLKEYTFDYSVQEIIPATASDPEMMKLIVAATKTKFVNNHVKAFKRGGLTLTDAMPEINAYANILNFNGLRDAVFLDIGDSQSSVHMFYNGEYEVSRTIDVGVMDMIDKVSERLSITSEQAREYFSEKREEVLNLPECIELYEMFNTELFRARSFYEYNFKDNMLDRIYYSGEGCFVKPLLEYLQSKSAIAVVSISELIPNQTTDPSSLERCAAACGAAMLDTE